MTLLNRDLSWLSFNFRVLEEAINNEVPLYERLKFMAIFSSNLNEFFRVRYPEIVALSLLKKKTKITIDANDNLLFKVQVEIERQLNIFGKLLQDEIIVDLKANGIIFYYDQPVCKEHLSEIREIFLSNVLSYIQPIYLDGTANNFSPENNHLYFVVTLQENKEGIMKQAIINIPTQKLKRFFTLTPLHNYEYVIFLDDIVRENLVYLFPRQKIVSVYSIKINRDSELNLEDEFSGNLLQKIEKQLAKRDFGPPSRLLFQMGMPRNLQMFLASAFNVNSDELFMGGRYHNLDDLSQFPSFNKNLVYPKPKPFSSNNMMNSGDIFKILLKEDVLLHVPYQSYNPVLSFFNQAAVDVDVTEIYITLYRVAEESHIINALISAAKNGKMVVAFVELKARFDEENNIKWSKLMKQAGVRIIYSIPEIKVHSKIALIRNKKSGHKKSFAILSTGNFNEVTAQFYSDHVLMTSDDEITSELLQLFQFLQLRNEVESGKKLKFNALLVAGFNMVPELYKLIEKEIAKAIAGEPALIRIKVNNLEDPEFIQQLYNASSAGVEIKLIVRSISCIAGGIPGESDHIEIRRIVDQYLEHSRILIFGSGEKTKVIIGSADLMVRNLRHRIEVNVRIKNEHCKKQLINFFELQWSDNDKASILLPDFNQQPVEGDKNLIINAQKSIYEYLKKND
ncbi:MAG: polyphosphate kinase 1 [Ginsengibacter sp.]